MLLEKYAGFAGAAQAAMRGLRTGSNPMPKPISAISKSFWGKAAKPKQFGAKKIMPPNAPAPVVRHKPEPAARPNAVVRAKGWSGGPLNKITYARQAIRRNLTRSR